MKNKEETEYISVLFIKDTPKSEQYKNIFESQANVFLVLTKSKQEI